LQFKISSEETSFSRKNFKKRNLKKKHEKREEKFSDFEHHFF